MSHIVESAPLAVRRDRSVEARRAERQAKAKRERRIVEFLNRGVSVTEPAEREGVARSTCARSFETFSLAACPSRPPSSSRCR